MVANKGVAHNEIARAFGTFVPGGEKLSEREIVDRCRELAGLPSNCKTQVQLVAVVKGGRLPLEDARRHGLINSKTRFGVNITASGGEVESAERFLTDTPDGLVCKNEQIILKSKGTGLGSKIFADQVAALQKVGAARIEADLSGDPYEGEDGKETRMNGYYTWPRLGYDAKIPARTQKALTKALGPKAKVATVQDLMKNKAGREAWKRLGVTVNGTFDLSKNSKGVRVLNKYVAEKKKRIAASMESGGYNLGENGPDDLDESLLDEIWLEVDRVQGWLPEDARPRMLLAFSPDQERDEKGRWSSGGGSAGDGSKTPAPTTPPPKPGLIERVKRALFGPTPAVEPPKTVQAPPPKPAGYPDRYRLVDGSKLGRKELGDAADKNVRQTLDRLAKDQKLTPTEVGHLREDLTLMRVSDLKALQKERGLKPIGAASKQRKDALVKQLHESASERNGHIQRQQERQQQHVQRQKYIAETERLKQRPAVRLFASLDAVGEEMDDEQIDLIAEILAAIEERHQIEAAFNPDQPRDEKGRWGDGGAVPSRPRTKRSRPSATSCRRSIEGSSPPPTPRP